MSAFVNIQDVQFGKGTSPTMITSAITQCIRKVCSFHIYSWADGHRKKQQENKLFSIPLFQAIESAETLLMEPIMYVEVVINEEHQPVVSADLSRRRADILDVGNRLNYRVHSVCCNCEFVFLLVNIYCLCNSKYYIYRLFRRGCHCQRC